MPPTNGPFPDFSLPGLDGVPRRLSEAWSRAPALLVIGHRDCKTTREALPLVDRIHRRRTRGTVTVILQDDAPAARELATQIGLEAPLQLEAEPYPLAAALDVTTVPTLFVVGPDGEITGVSEGLSRADLEAFALRLGVPGRLFGPEDAKIPALKPG